MNYFIVIFKEVVETIYRQLRIVANGNKYNEKIVSIMGTDGFTTEINFYSKEKCQVLRGKIDNLIKQKDTNVWVDDEGADHRIYFINDLDDDFKAFYEHPRIRKILASYTGSINPSGMLLAARIDAKEGNLGSGGGWHRDSPITHQFKAVCYLSDVTEKNGPFQYIKASHKKIHVLRSYFSGVFKPGQYRFTEHEIDSYLGKTGQTITDFTAKEGTIAFADTKGIHRGKPIEEGSRYVLFCYFWNGGIPTHFDKLKQEK